MPFLLSNARSALSICTVLHVYAGVEWYTNREKMHVFLGVQWLMSQKKLHKSHEIHEVDY